MQTSQRSAIVIGNNWGAAVTAISLRQLGLLPTWIQTGLPEPFGHALLPGAAKTAADCLASAASEQCIAWSHGLTFSSPQGLQDTLQTDDLPAPFHLLPSLVGLDVLSWPQRLEIGRGLLAALQCGDQDLSPASTLAQWLLRNGQHSPVALSFWTSLSVLTCAALPQHITAGQGVPALRDALLSTPDAARVGFLPQGVSGIVEASAEGIKATEGMVMANTVISIQKKGNGSVLVKLADGQDMEASCCILTDSTVAAALCERPVTHHAAPESDLQLLRLSIRVASQEESRPTCCASLGDGPVQWLFRQPPTAQAGVEGVVTPVWAWIAKSHASEHTVIAETKQAMQQSWGLSSSIEVCSSELTDIPTPQPVLPPIDTGSERILAFNGAWSNQTGLIGEATAQQAYEAAKQAAHFSGLNPEPIASEPSGRIYQFMLG